MTANTARDFAFYAASVLGDAGYVGPDLVNAVSEAGDRLLPGLTDDCTHDEILNAVTNFARTKQQAATSQPKAPTAVDEAAFVRRFGQAALRFPAADKITLTRTLERELGIAAPKASDRPKPASVSAAEMQEYFGAGVDVSKIPAGKRLAAFNVIAARKSAA